jgi:hypothetical protein
VDGSTNGHQPAGTLRWLTWTQIEAINSSCAGLWAFVARNGGEATLSLVVKDGKPRFIESGFPASDQLPTEEPGRLPWSEVESIDAKIASLCAYTARKGGVARLVLSISQPGTIDSMNIALGAEFKPAK